MTDNTSDDSLDEGNGKHEGYYVAGWDSNALKDISSVGYLQQLFAS